MRRRKRKRGEMPLVEFRPGVFARLGESTRGSDGRRWFLATDRAGKPQWFRADVPLDGGEKDTPPPELRTLPCPVYRKSARYTPLDPV